MEPYASDFPWCSSRPSSPEPNQILEFFSERWKKISSSFFLNSSWTQDGWKASHRHFTSYMQMSRVLKSCGAVIKCWSRINKMLTHHLAIGFCIHKVFCAFCKARSRGFASAKLKDLIRAGHNSIFPNLVIFFIPEFPYDRFSRCHALPSVRTARVKSKATI